MANHEIEQRRAAWREAFDPYAPLALQLDRPYVPAWQVAIVMGLSENSVYQSAKAYNHALSQGDTASAFRHVPCPIFGRTHRIPTEAFITWWETAGRVRLEPIATTSLDRR